MVLIALGSILAANPVSAQVAPPDFRCPETSFAEVRREPPIPDVLTAIVPPLRILNMLADDPLAKLATRPVSITVVDDADRPVANAVVGVIHEETSRFIAEGAGGGRPVNLPLGKYLVNAANRAKDQVVRWGATSVTVDAKGPAIVKVRLDRRLPAVVTKPAPANVAVGTPLALEISGFLQERATLVVLRREADRRAAPTPDRDIVLAETQIQAGSAPQVLLPGRGGKYDILYLLCAPRLVLARWTVTARPADVALAAPDRAPMGSLLRATVRGTISPAYTLKLGQGEQLPAVSKTLGDGVQQEIEIRLPYTPGSYDLTVTTHDDVVLARRKVKVDAAMLAIAGPDRINLGESAAFSWADSGNIEFKLELWTPASGSKPARRIGDIDRDGGRPPAGPGDYEVRLVPWSAADKRVLGRKSLRIEGQAFEEPPREAAANSTLTVRVAFKVSFWDRLMFVPRGAEPVGMPGPSRDRDDRSMSIDTPKAPGPYDLVFLLGSVRGRVEAGRVPIDVR